jgi:hypothetical protein
MLLYVGRLDILAKAHPLPLFLAAERASMRTRRHLHLVLAGWFRDPRGEVAFRDAAATFAPSVHFVLLDGRLPQVRQSVWQAADIFVSPVDNIQESFGLTPVEAMAAGLPVVAGDWDGYRDTVRHGIDGFLAPSLMPSPGSAPDLAATYSARTLDYDHYIGLASQAVALDVEAMASALARLAESPSLRHEMGRAGRRRACSEFDWGKIVPRYQALWRELAARRRHAPPARRASVHPARPDPFHAFAGYATAVLTPDTRLIRGAGSPELLDGLLASPLLAFAAQHLLAAEEMRQILGRAAGGGGTASELLAGLDRPPSPIAWRSLIWLVKFGLLAVEADGDRPHPARKRRAER